MQYNCKSNSSVWSTLTPEAMHQIALLSVFMLVALSGNSIILIHLIRKKGWLRPVSFFVMSLATTDILIAVLSMSTELLWQAFGEWIFGNFACKFATYVQCLLFISTSCILVSMSWDRYQAICKPLRAISRSLARCRRTIISSWLLAAVLALPQIFIFVQVQDGEHKNGRPKYSCKSAGYTAEWQRKVYVTWTAMLVFIIPMLVVAFCYIRIAAVVWKIPDFVPARNDGSQDIAETFVLRRHRSRQSKRGCAERNKMKAIHLTIWILACYILCWLPYFTINLLNVWTDYKFKHTVPSFLKSLAKCLAWFSSCVNPIIYGTFHLSFCPSPSRMLPDCCKKQSSLGFDSAMTYLQPSLRVRRDAICSDTRRAYAARPIPLSILASSVTPIYASQRGSADGSKKTNQDLPQRTPHDTLDDCGGTWL